MSIRWFWLAMLGGALAGAAWGWFGSGGYESGDSALGTGLLGVLAGPILLGLARGAVLLVRKDRPSSREPGR